MNVTAIEALIPLAAGLWALHAWKRTPPTTLAEAGWRTRFAPALRYLGPLLLVHSCLILTLDPPAVSDSSQAESWTWTEYRSPTDHFRVEFPGAPAPPEISRTPTTAGELESRRVAVSQLEGRVFLSVCARTYTDAMRVAGLTPTLEAAVAGVVGARAGNQLTSSRTIEVNGHEARAFTCDCDNGYTIRGILLYRERTLISVLAVTPSALAAGHVERLFSSFQVER